MAETGTTVIIFDCDGVLFDSNTLKTKAFRKVLAPYPPKAVERFLANHRRTGGVSRYVKFNHFLTEIMGEEDCQETLKNLLDAYGRECEALYRHAAFTPGCPEILTEFSQRATLFVASGGAEEELRRVFRHRRIDRCFEAVFGSPKTKEACVSAALSACPNRREAVMVGDSESDFLAATGAGIDFVFMSRYSENRKHMEELAGRHGFPIIDNLTQWRRRDA